jgi:glutamate/aspartate transport system substrate-binding protein
MMASVRSRKGAWHWLALACIALSAGANAQDAAEGTAEKLTGTLKKVRDSGTITLGYREASMPFSYAVAGRPIGYSIDLCREIVDAVSAELNGRELTIKYVPVTAETRIAAVREGRVDLECGSTTNNVERQEQVAFSPIIFVSGTKLMVRADSSIRSYRDLVGKTVAVTAGTTNEKEMGRLSEKFKLGIKFLVGRDHDESYGFVASGKADAFATDDALLFGFIAARKAQKQFTVVGDFLTYDPYGLMYRKNDPQMSRVVEATLRRLAESRELEDIYVRWFQGRLPTGERLNIPMSAQLREIFHVLGAPE